MFQFKNSKYILSPPRRKVGEDFYERESTGYWKSKSRMPSYIVGILITLTSCFNSNTNTAEISRLNLRITELEQKVDSFVNARNTYSTGSNKESNDTIAYGTVQKTNRCQAITKKGRQCKRVSDGDGYCWQHGK